MSDQKKPSLQDFALVSTHIAQISKEKGLVSQNAFYYFVLDLILNLQDDEIEESITDTFYLASTSRKEDKGHDRGIDAIYIDESITPAVVHIFNNKYTEDFKKTSTFFPANEIDKIIGFISSLMQVDDNMKETVNPVLFDKIKDIWKLYNSQNLHFEVHICSNFYNNFEHKEQQRFEREVAKFSNFRISYHPITYFVDLLTKQGKSTVNAKIKMIDQNLFEKSDGDVRALIGDVDVRELIRVVVDDEQIRNEADLDDYSKLCNYKILEDVFEDNVRINLKQRSKINRNIKETALSSENFRFFYFNNGITLTCTGFSYPKNKRSPIVELKNFQVVNGCQTINALFEAFKENPNIFKNVDVLCRIYETSNEPLSVDIAEYTNSQNPVTSRDIRSNDYIQKKLGKELEVLGFFYERKKRQHQGKNKSMVIDAEKAGQALMAFFNKMPAEAKNQKRIIFAEKYDEVFADSITADRVLLAHKLFNKIEAKKKTKRQQIANDQQAYETEGFVLFATYYILYAISEIAELASIPKSLVNLDKLFGCYDNAVQLVKESMESEMKHLAGYKEKYSHQDFFRSNKPKKYFEGLLKVKSKKI